MENLIVGDGRSAALEPSDIKNLKQLVKRCKTIKAAAQSIGIDRGRLPIILESKSCHPDTLKKIRKFFEPVTVKSSAKETSAA